MPDQEIHSAERKWKESILQCLSRLYAGQWLPSHDIGHHNRVWKNACELSIALKKKHPIHDEYFYEKLFLACFFHDTGLWKDRGENHGKISRRLCEDFLSQHEDCIEFHADDMLEAIEYHDLKNYEEASIIKSNNFYHLLTIADDLDALGAFGAYRYIEIYLIRGVEIHEMSSQILNNVRKRYDYFIESIHGYDLDRKKYQIRYNTITSLLDDSIFSEKPVSLIRWIQDEIVFPKKDPFQYIMNCPSSGSENNRIGFFVKEFLKEYEDA